MSEGNVGATGARRPDGTHRVVITGMGAVSPAGVGVQADSHDGVDLGYGEPVRQAVVQRLLLDAQDGVERAGQ